MSCRIGATNATGPSKSSGGSLQGGQTIDQRLPLPPPQQHSLYALAFIRVELGQQHGGRGEVGGAEGQQLVLQHAQLLWKCINWIDTLVIYHDSWQHGAGGGMARSSAQHQSPRQRSSVCQSADTASNKASPRGSWPGHRCAAAAPVPAGGTGAKAETRRVRWLHSAGQQGVLWHAGLARQAGQSGTDHARAQQPTNSAESRSHTHNHKPTCLYMDRKVCAVGMWMPWHIQTSKKNNPHIRIVA